MVIPPRPSLSAGETASLLAWALCLAPAKVLLSVSRTLVKAWSRGLPFGPYALCGVFRVLFYDLTPEQIQAILPGTLETYHHWIKDVQHKAPNGPNGAIADRLQERIETLSPKSSLMWLGNPATAEKVVLLFHGGGYKAPLSPGHIDLCVQSFMLANPNVEIAVAMLQYTLVPARYPTQLQQAAVALKHLLKSGFKPENIIIGGDSSGGNLTVAILSHILHPHPDVEPLELSRPLLGAFTVSPWVSSRIDHVSFQTNDGIDMLSAPILAIDVEGLVSGTNFDSERRQGKGWTYPLDVDESWLDGLDKAIQNMYISTGEHEVFKSQDIVLGDIVRRRSPNVKLEMVVAPKEAHNFWFIEGQLQAFGDATKRLKDWTSGIVTGQK